LGNQEAFYEEVELLRMGMFGHGKLIGNGHPWCLERGPKAQDKSGSRQDCSYLSKARGEVLLEVMQDALG
jgi:hypothetical protein